MRHSESGELPVDGYALPVCIPPGLTDTEWRYLNRSNIVKLHACMHNFRLSIRWSLASKVPQNHVVVRQRCGKKNLAHSLPIQDHVDFANVTKWQERSICIFGASRNKTLKSLLVSQCLADD